MCCTLQVSLRAQHCTVLHCTVLHCTALHCTALHCTALHCTALHCTALHCTALHCTALHCTELHCTAPHCTALEYGEPRTVTPISNGSLRTGSLSEHILELVNLRTSGALEKAFREL